MRCSIKFALLPGLPALMTMALVSCDVDTPSAPQIPLGEENLRRSRPVVSLGNSLTAGFMNGGLELRGQQLSFPNQLSKLVGGELLPGSFLDVYMEMPLVASPGIGNVAGKSSLYVDPNTSEITRRDLQDPSLLLRRVDRRAPYDNLGVPGATTTDALEAISAQSSASGNNPWFDWILRNSAVPPHPALPPFNTTQLDQLEAHFRRNTNGNPEPSAEGWLPKVMTIWLGNNDILGGGLSGDPVLGVNVKPVSVFETEFKEILDRIAGFARSTHIALGNVQQTLPYFTTVPLGELYEGEFERYNTDEANVQFVLLSARSELNLGPDYLSAAGGDSSIASKYTLTLDEWLVLQSEIASYNAIIAAEASARGWALADVRGAFAELPADPTDQVTFETLNRVFPWLDLSGDGVPEQNVNSAFSLDGIHPSEKGYALVTNVFAAALSAKYGADYGQVEIDDIVNEAGFPSTVAPQTVLRVNRDGIRSTVFDGSGRERLRDLIIRMGAER